MKKAAYAQHEIGQTAKIRQSAQQAEKLFSDFNYLFIFIKTNHGLFGISEADITEHQYHRYGC